MTLTVLDVGGVDYESYASVTEADNIIAVDPVRMSAWAALSEDDKKIYLIAATNRLDLLGWQGSKTGGASQEHAFPRSGLQYADGSAVDDSTIPDIIARGTSLLAGSIAIRPAQADEGTSAQAISAIKAGPVEIEYFRRDQSVRGTPLQDETVWRLVLPWLETGAAILAPVVTGTDGGSSFTDRDAFDWRAAR